jgi:hypothetical protein
MVSASALELSPETPGATSPTSEAVGLLAFVWLALVVLTVLLAVGAWLAFVFHRRSVVRASSTALRDLEELNQRSRNLIVHHPPIAHVFKTSAKSKAHYDKYDLASHLTVCVLEHEAFFEREIALRNLSLRQFGVYQHDVVAIRHQRLGRSGHPRIPVAKFAAIELKLFERANLTEPIPKAAVRSTLDYTSPKGQNSYSRQVSWNFDQLVSGLKEAQDGRARKSTVQALRQRERSLMTPSLRMKVLRRDQFRCKMCGASSQDGANLHVDHIVPVSRGGLTLIENLQILCQPCNIGKSNTFVG